jgi:hypothetical protein
MLGGVVILKIKITYFPKIDVMIWGGGARGKMIVNMQILLLGVQKTKKRHNSVYSTTPTTSLWGGHVYGVFLYSFNSEFCLVNKIICLVWFSQ